MKSIDIYGNEVDTNTTPIVASLYLSAKLRVVYRAEKRDIKHLIEGLQRFGCKQAHFLEPDYWANTICSEIKGKCGGKCASGVRCRKEWAGPYKICGCWDE